MAKPLCRSIGGVELADPKYKDLPTANGRIAPAVWDGEKWNVLQGTTDGSMKVFGDTNTKLVRTNMTEFLMEDQELSPGINYINFEALGNAFGLGIYTVQNASVTIRLTYIIPGTTNFTLEPYADILTMENDDRAVIKYENVKSSHIRMIVRNEGTEPIEVKSLHVTHFL